MINPKKPGMYIAVTPKLIALVKIVNVSPFLNIKNGINLIKYWQEDEHNLLTETEYSHIQSCHMTSKLVLIPILDSNIYEQFNITKIPMSKIEYSQEDMNNWRETYIALQQTGTDVRNLINTIMFDGPYTIAQATLIFDFIKKKLGNTNG